MQKNQVIGNIGKDAEIIESNGKSFIGFSVAANEGYKDKEGVKHNKTTWYNVYLSENFKNLVPFLKSGSKIYVEGKFSVRQWEKDGKNGVELRIGATFLELLSPKKEEETKDEETKTQPENSGSFPENDDLPF